MEEIDVDIEDIILLRVPRGMATASFSGVKMVLPDISKEMEIHGEGEFEVKGNKFKLVVKPNDVRQTAIISMGGNDSENACLINKSFLYQRPEYLVTQVFHTPNVQQPDVVVTAPPPRHDLQVRYFPIGYSDGKESKPLLSTKNEAKEIHKSRINNNNTVINNSNSNSKVHEIKKSDNVDKKEKEKEKEKVKEKEKEKDKEKEKKKEKEKDHTKEIEQASGKKHKKHDDNDDGEDIEKKQPSESKKKRKQNTD